MRPPARLRLPSVLLVVAAMTAWAVPGSAAVAARQHLTAPAVARATPSCGYGWLPPSRAAYTSRRAQSSICCAAPVLWCPNLPALSAKKRVSVTRGRKAP